MKCNKCSAEWNIGKSMTVITKCPFCGEEFQKETKIEQQTEKVVDLATTFKRIVDERGEDVLKDEVFLNLFSDYAPELSNEKRLLKGLFNDLQINLIFLEESGNQPNSQDRRITKAIRKMKSNFVADNMIEMVVTAFVYALRWDEKILLNYFKKDESKTEVTVPQDEQKNLQQTKSAVVSEEAEMQYQEGEMYYYGRGVDINYVKAKYCFQKAAEQGHVKAQSKLGDMYHNEIGVARDPVKAVEWHRKAAEQGHAKSQNYLGDMYYNKKDYVKAAEWYRKAADGGQVSAQYRLGVMCFDGKLIKQDYNVALDLFQKAESQGNMYASYYLGLMYENGLGVDEDVNTAKQHYKKAAKQGHMDSKKRIEEIENEVIIVDAEAQFQKGWEYENNKDYVKAVKWYQKAANQGHTKSQNHLGDMYYNKKDYVKSAECYQKAAEQGHVDAQNSLGLLYLYSKGVVGDYSKALDLFQKADRQGCMYAPYNIGRMYENGWGVDKDIIIARNYYVKAANRGHAGSKKKLEEIENENARGVTERIKLLRNAFDENFWLSIPISEGVAVLDLISPKKAQKAISTYAKNTGINIGDIKVLFSSVFTGLIITDRFIIGSKGKELLPLNRISHLEAKRIKVGDDIMITALVFEKNNELQEHDLFSLSLYRYSDQKVILKKINEFIFNEKSYVFKVYLPKQFSL